MASLREAQKQMTRRLLLEKGLELFEAKGYSFGLHGVRETQPAEEVFIDPLPPNSTEPVN